MRTVLIVEDEKKVRGLYRRFLAQERFRVLEAEDGQQASMTLASTKTVDLVLLDIRVPVLSGPALFVYIKAVHPEAKVIVASAYSMEDQRQAIASADDYFDKAEGIEILRSRVRTVLKEGRH